MANISPSFFEIIQRELPFDNFSCTGNNSGIIAEKNASNRSHHGHRPGVLRQTDVVQDALILPGLDGGHGQTAGPFGHLDAVEVHLILRGSRGKIDLMKKKQKNILLIAGMLLVLLVGILAYSAYTQKQIYQESTANLLSTYGQSAKTFTMFAQRNWNILTDWDGYLGALAERGEQEGLCDEPLPSAQHPASRGD